MPTRFRLCDIGADDALEGRVVLQELDREGLAGLGVDELVALEAPSRPA